MKTVQESPEHHFLTFLDKIKQDPNGWVGIHAALSRKLGHKEILEQLDHIKGKLFKLQKECDMLAAAIPEAARNMAGATLYRFSDGDIVFLACPQNESEQNLLRKLHADLREKTGDSLCSFGNLARDIFSYQKLADDRFLSSRRMAAYESLSDANRVQSIGLRRTRREDPMILLVEDDRFTATFTANLLHKDYDLVHAKTGEEAIIFYIEHAPDIVLMDIHLPGLSGHETLQAIRKADPEAYVVMLSVDTVKQNIVMASDFGASGFLKKPFSKERLLAVVQKSPFIKQFGRHGAPGGV